MGDPDLPGTVLRLPMVYGPGDRQRRYYPVLKRIFDGRRRIIFSAGQAHWRAPRGYVENVAAAVTLAATSPAAAGRIYNVCEEPPHSELEWARMMGKVAGWKGEFVVLPDKRTPAHLLFPANLKQDAAASSARIRQELAYSEPVPINEAIRRTVEWEKATPPAPPLPYQFKYEVEDAAIQFATT
jgi:nucleoside-diphosphate-sugar epimerase